MKPNMMDIYIYDLQGNRYDINSIHIDGNDMLSIVIKKPNEEYISRRKARELLEHIKELRKVIDEGNCKRRGKMFRKFW